MTNNIEIRMYQHKNGIIDGFSKKYGLKKMVYCEFYQYVNDVIKREKQLKNWKRDWKIALIEEENKEWNDLAFDWFD
jgi:putative endonuclease